MNGTTVTRDEVLSGFDALADIYGHVPPLILWRAWEHAVYRKYPLVEPVLDIGCGDGRFFQRVFPGVRDVVGIDMNEDVVNHARHTGTYTDVHLAPAHRLPLADASFASAFANCAIEHMDHLDTVLAEIHRVLRPGGTFLASVVTDRFVSWAPISRLMHAAGAADAGRAAQAAHEAYHHLVNALPADEWRTRLERAGFRIDAWEPVVSGIAGWVFLFLDQLWHTPLVDDRQGAGEHGDLIAPWMLEGPERISGLRHVFQGLLEMSTGTRDHAGLVFLVTK